ncbi:MAG: UDP-N-acetylmuramoyl-tripeptide--D-alanyl-D-alanine ligase [Desulfobacterales bacterium]
MAEKEPWSTAQILKATGGKLLSGNPESVFSGISTDSRTISGGQLFIAIKGEHYDGHSFVPDVAEKGGMGLIISGEKAGELIRSKWKHRDPVCIAVEDTVRALGDLAAFRRKQTGVSLVAITGSNGKTTTRQMTASILSKYYQTLSTSGNFNNEIGLPLTLLRLDAWHEWAVVELGMNHPGEIGRLTRICAPDIGVITNIGPAHLEGLGSVEAVARAKGELLREMPPDTIAVLNADDPACRELAAQSAQEVITFGLSEDAQVRAFDVKRKGMEISFVLEISPEMAEVCLHSPAKFMVHDALAAAAAAYGSGLSAKKIAPGLSDFRPAEGRMNVFETRREFYIIDDTYNANPGSVKAALTTLADLKGKNRAFAVLGDMLELGTHADRLHREIGMFCADSGIDRLLLTGPRSEQAAAGAMERGMKAQQIFTGSREELLAYLKENLQLRDWVLIKGSRGMKMELIPDTLRAWADNVPGKGN